MKGMADESGYSLVEVLVAIVFIGVAIAALFTAIMQGVYVQKAAEMEAVALNLANAAIERYRSYFNAGNYDYLVTRSTEEEEAELAELGRLSSLCRARRPTAPGPSRPMSHMT